MDYTHEMICCIVNTGFSEAVMDAAKEFGARGGTVVHARGTADKEAEKFFHITVQPDKEMVMILVPAALKEDILHALYKAVGLKTPGQGIAFSLPVDQVIGLTPPDALPKAENKPSPDGEQAADDKAADKTEADQPTER